LLTPGKSAGIASGPPRSAGPRCPPCRPALRSSGCARR